ncbi:MAG: hypothetical protein VX715_02635 [Planctomycetota bacterium]|nr:hypothetical protein [Planctomycetota bacterium]
MSLATATSRVGTERRSLNGTPWQRVLAMIHYSCDRCKRLIDPEVDLRYVLRLEVQAIMEPLDSDDLDDERDHLLEIQEMLEQLEEGESDQLADDFYQKHRYDICADCYHEYLKNPLGREVPMRVGFSEN